MQRVFVSILLSRQKGMKRLHMNKKPRIIVNSMTEETAFRRILSNQLLRYPRLEVQDLYKLVYQAAMGSEHAVQDAAMARDWLERELGELGEGPEEAAVDSISPAGRIVRINLRPYIAAGGNPTALLTAFVRTANEYQGTLPLLRRFWSFVERMADAREWPFALVELEGFFGKMETGGFPAVHHSRAYQRAYHPAYRVIVYDFLESAIIET
jgi:hypothetical protein